MGISLIPKDIELSVNGKVKHTPKPRLTNANLPFPRDSYSIDLKFWQSTFIPDWIDWIATKEDAFGVNAHPDFNDAVLDLWKTYFGAYPHNDAVFAQVSH
jgi:hypothetical protein